MYSRGLYIHVYMLYGDGHLTVLLSEPKTQPDPPALSSGGRMRKGKKADLMSCLEDDSQYIDCMCVQEFSVKILDGAVVINVKKSTTALNPRLF